MKVNKVLTLGWEFAPLITGGLGVVCRDLTEHLIKKGLSVKFVLPRIPNKLNLDSHLQLINANEYENADAKLTTIPVMAKLLPYGGYVGYGSTILNKEEVEAEGMLYGQNLLEEIEKFALRTIKIALENNYDVIHAHDWMTFKAAVNAKIISGKPLITHIHATEYDRSGGNPHPEIAMYEKWGMQYADRVIAVSERTKQIIIDKYGIPEAKIVVVHNAVEHDPENKTLALRQNSDEKIVLFLGRMSVQKGADYLLKAAAKVIKHLKNVRFVFVGDGDMLKNLIDLSIDLGISKNITFTGFLNFEQRDIAFKSADLFVMPSVSEPFGLTSLEAIRNGTPVIMSKQSGASEVIQNALKVDYWDIDEMADKIIAVLKHSILAETLKEKSKIDLQRISWDRQADKVIEVYDSLL